MVKRTDDTIVTLQSYGIKDVSEFVARYPDATFLSIISAETRAPSAGYRCGYYMTLQTDNGTVLCTVRTTNKFVLQTARRKLSEQYAGTAVHVEEDTPEIRAARAAARKAIMSAPVAEYARSGKFRIIANPCTGWAFGVARAGSESALAVCASMKEARLVMAAYCRANE